LEHLIKQIVENCIYPSGLKLALLHPIHKTGSKSEIGNYRPISMLPIIGKIVEKVITEQITMFVEENEILSPNQFGFRKGRSCESAANTGMAEIAEAIGRKEKCLAIFCDLSKAYDTINCNRLINKLEKIGVRDRAVKLITSLLTKRRQILKSHNSESNIVEVKQGLPQGALISPILYAVYTNDLLIDESIEQTTLAFADDTVVIVKAHTLKDLYSRANETLRKVANWMWPNGLVLNPKKTKYIIFDQKQPISTDLSIKVHSLQCQRKLSPDSCHCNPLERVKEYKYLGLTIDEELSFKPHINNVCKKLRSGLAMLRRIKYIASISFKREIYFAVIQSHIQYMLNIYGTAPTTQINRIMIAQKKTIRLVAGTHSRAHTKNIFSKLNIRNIYKLYLLSLLKHNYVNSTELQRPQHSHFTRFRASGKLTSIKRGTKVSETNPTIKFTRLFNLLPEHLSNVLSNPRVVKDNFALRSIKLYVDSLPDEKSILDTLGVSL